MVAVVGCCFAPGFALSTWTVRATEIHSTMCWSNARQQLRAGVGYLLKTREPGQQWLNSGLPPAGCFPCQLLLRTSPSFLLSRVCASCGSTTFGDSPQACAKMCLSTGAHVIAPDPSISPSRNNRLPDYGTCGKELANEKSESCLERQSLLAKTFVLRKHRVSCHRVERKQMSAMSTIFARNITPTFFPFRKL